MEHLDKAHNHGRVEQFIPHSRRAEAFAEFDWEEAQLEGWFAEDLTKDALRITYACKVHVHVHA